MGIRIQRVNRAHHFIIIHLDVSVSELVLGPIEMYFNFLFVGFQFLLFFKQTEMLNSLDSPLRIFAVDYGRTCVRYRVVAIDWLG